MQFWGQEPTYPRKRNITSTVQWKVKVALAKLNMKLVPILNLTLLDEQVLAPTEALA